jgi:2-oxoglutarate dehydrogenase E2 component (dihydrolipoamide succinyltransferase)
MPTNVIMPQMGESIAEGTVTRWLKKVGDQVQRDEPLLEISTDKVDAEIPSPASGVLTQILVRENETVVVNAVLATIDDRGAGVAAPDEERREAKAEGRAPTVAPPSAVAAPPAADEAAAKLRSSPIVRRLAREHHLDLRQIKGTGRGGRVSKKDIDAYLAQARTMQPAPSATPQAPPPAPTAVAFTGPTEVVPMTAMRRQIAERMVLSQRTSAHVTSVFEVEMTKVVDAMGRFGDEFERRHGWKLTYTPFFVRAAVKALKDFPIVNASVEGTNIVYKRNLNIGVAVALETGLIVPVIKRAEEKSFVEVARAVKDLAERARSKRLSVEDVQDGTFTITNPGVFGSLFGTPIIHQPQVAILGVGAIEKRPVVREDAIAIRPMVYLALTFDHRILDGAVADQFLSRIKAVLEAWDEPVL